jgi:hypothetical protein
VTVQTINGSDVRLATATPVSAHLGSGDTPVQVDASVSVRPWFAPLVAGDLAALWPAIVTMFAGVLAIGFVMSFHGLFVFGDKIMHWAVALCALAPVGLDVFSMLALLATFLTRDARWRIRAYTWFVFGVTVGLSIAGNALSEIAVAQERAEGVGRQFEWGYQQFSSVAGAAVWPLAYAAGLHTLLVVRRHLDTKRDRVEKLSQEADQAAAEELVLRARAIELAATGATVPAILAELALADDKRRSVERWTKDIRAALAAKPVTPPAKAAPRRRPEVRRTEESS